MVLIYMLLGMGLNMASAMPACSIRRGVLRHRRLQLRDLASGQFDIHLPLASCAPSLAARSPASPACFWAFPLLRLRGDCLAIVTLGFGEIIRLFLNNLDV
jgi:branched-chain amino acid transport system permease protein